jgi:toxin FitB
VTSPKAQDRCSNSTASPKPLPRYCGWRAGALRGQLAARGLVRHQADMLIAATAQAHQLTLVPRNIRDFEDCGIGLLNPFSNG